MKTKLAALTLVISLLGGSAISQADLLLRPPSGEPDVRLKVLDVESGRFMSCDSPFRNGQKFRLHLQSVNGGHVYLVNVSPSGDRSQIFPVLDESNVYEVGPLEIPPSDQPPFEFDHESGTEMVEIIISKAPIKRHEVARRSPSFRETGGTAASSIAETIEKSAAGVSGRGKVDSDVVILQTQLRHF